jgi:hypothetical protein
LKGICLNYSVAFHRQNIYVCHKSIQFLLSC